MPETEVNWIPDFCASDCGNISRELLNELRFAYSHISNGVNLTIAPTPEGWFRVTWVSLRDPCCDIHETLGTFPTISAAIEAIRSDALEPTSNGNFLGAINVPEYPNDWDQHCQGPENRNRN